MSKVINIQAAKTHLSRLVEEVVAGEEVILAKAGKPLVKFVRYEPARQPRVGGALKGQISVSPDCWTTPIPGFASSVTRSIYPVLDHNDAQVADDPS